MKKKILKKTICSLEGEERDYRIKGENDDNCGEDEDEDDDEEEEEEEEKMPIERGKNLQLQLKPSGTSKFGFLEEQIRRLRSPRFREVHHKRVPTPMKKKRPRYIRLSTSPPGRPGENLQLEKRDFAAHPTPQTRGEGTG